jgi:hypothetical protein
LAGRRKIDNRAVTLGGADLAVVSELTGTLSVFEAAGYRISRWSIGCGRCATWRGDSRLRPHESKWMVEASIIVPSTLKGAVQRVLLLVGSMVGRFNIPATELF